MKTKKTLKAKLTLYILIMMIVSFCVMTFISITIGEQALEKNTKALLTESAKELNDKIESTINDQIKDVEMISLIPRVKNINIKLDDKKDILSAGSDEKQYEKIGISDLNGNLTYINGETENVKDIECFKRALKGESNSSNIIKDKNGDEKHILIAVPIKSEKGVEQVLVAYKSIQFLQDMCEKATFLKTGSYFLLDEEGTEIADKDASFVKKKVNIQKQSLSDKSLEGIAKIEKEMVNGKSGVGEYKLDGVRKYISYTPIKSINCSAGVLVQKNEALGQLSYLLKTLIIASLILIAVMIILIIRLLHIVIDPVSVIKKQMDVIGDGDFTNKIDEKYLRQEDEIGEMCRTLTKTQNHIGELIGEIQESSEEIDGKSSSLAALSEELTALTENILTAMEDVTEGNNKQSTDLSEISIKIEGFGDIINEICNNIHEINNMSKRISEKSSNSNEEMKILIGSITSFDKKFLNFSKNISNMDEKIKNVTEITNLINIISEQTNLLALNAAIEAARAGESGKGFAVVADEIRSLAERSIDSSNKIYEIINTLLVNTNIIVDETDKMSKELESQKHNVESSIEAFTEISNSVENIIPRIALINAKCSKVEDDKLDILQGVERVTAVAQEISASSEEILASVEDVKTSTEEVAASAQVLTNRTDSMNEKIDIFKV